MDFHGRKGTVQKVELKRTASMAAPNVIVLNTKNATQYPNRGDDEAGVGDIDEVIIVVVVDVLCFTPVRLFCHCVKE